MKFKKLLLVLITLVVVQVNSLTQVNIDIGGDTVYCAGPNPDTMYLGNIHIENGLEPYTFAWECSYNLTPNIVLSASDFLNDSTIANPYFINWLTEDGEWLQLNLNVTDNGGSVGVDSILVGFSGCVCLTGEVVIEINQGDSILLDASSDTNEKYNKFYWEPDYGLSHPDSSITWCKPEVSTSYSIVKIDTFGCSCSCPVYDIRIKPASIDQRIDRVNNTQIKILQVGTYIYFDNPNGHEANISLFSLNGRKIQSIKSYEDYFDISGILRSKGIYIININVGNLSINGKIQTF